MSAFVLSQILAAAAFIFGLSSYQCKNRKYMLLLLSVAQMSTSIHFFLLDATTAGFVMLLSSIRFFVALWTTRSFVKDIFVALVLSVGAYTFTYAYDLLPIVAGIFGTLGAFSADGRQMRYFFMGGTIAMLTFNSIIFSPVAIFSGLFFLTSALLGYWRFYIRKQVEIEI